MTQRAKTKMERCPTCDAEPLGDYCGHCGADLAKVERNKHPSITEPMVEAAARAMYEGSDWQRVSPAKMAVYRRRARRVLEAAFSANFEGPSPQAYRDSFTTWGGA